MEYRAYLYNGELNSVGHRENLIKCAVKDYCLRNNINWQEDEIHREKLGKPYIKNTSQAVHFSISHTENTWICLVGSKNCGVDIQKITDANWKRLAERFFTENEFKAISACDEVSGKKLFFEIWTRIEAYSKHTGKGIFGKRPSLVDEELKVKDNIENTKFIKIEQDFCASKKDIVGVFCIEDCNANDKIVFDFDCNWVEIDGIR